MNMLVLFTHQRVYRNFDFWPRASHKINKLNVLCASDADINVTINDVVSCRRQTDIYHKHTNL